MMHRIRVDNAVKNAPVPLHVIGVQNDAQYVTGNDTAESQEVQDLQKNKMKFYQKKVLDLPLQSNVFFHFSPSRIHTTVESFKSNMGGPRTLAMFKLRRTNWVYLWWKVDVLAVLELEDTGFVTLERTWEPVDRGKRTLYEWIELHAQVVEDSSTITEWFWCVPRLDQYLATKQTGQIYWKYL